MHGDLQPFLRHMGMQMSCCCDDAGQSSGHIPSPRQMTSLHLNTSIAALKKQLEGSEQEAYALEAKKDQQLQAATQKTLTYGQVCHILPSILPSTHSPIWPSHALN